MHRFYEPDFPLSNTIFYWPSKLVCQQQSGAKPAPELKKGKLECWRCSCLMSHKLWLPMQSFLLLAYAMPFGQPKWPSIRTAKVICSVRLRQTSRSTGEGCRLKNDHSSSRTKFMFANRVAFLGKIWIPEIECVHSVGYAIRHWFCAIQFPVCFLSKILRWSNAYQWPLTLPIQLDSACQLNALGHTLVEFMFATWDTYNGSGMHLLWMTISRLWPFTK